MTSVPSYHVRGTHTDRDGEDGTAVDGHVNFDLVNHHHRRSYRDVAANVKDTGGSDGINDDLHYRDSPAPGAVEDESAAMRLSNLRSGRKHGAFHAWESHDGPPPHYHRHHPHHRHLNPPPPPLTSGVYLPDQLVPSASVIRVTKENVHHSNPSTSSHLPYTNKSNKHNSKKRSSSHFGPEERSVKRSPSPEPSTSGSTSSSTSGFQSNQHEHIFKHHHHIKSNKHAHNKHSKSSSHEVPHLDRIAKEPTSVSAAAYHPEVPYVDSDDNVETSDSDVDVMNSPPPGECCYTPTEELWQGAPPALQPPVPPPPPPAHSGAHHHGQYGGAYARPRSAQLNVRLKHASPRDSYTTDGATDRSCRFHQRPAEDVNLDRNAVQRQYADPYDQHLLSGAYGAMASQQLTNAAERELFASGGFPSAAAVNLSTKETNSDDSDIEVVSIIETKKPRLRSSKRGRSATVVVDLTKSDTEAGPSATQSRPGDSVADGDPVIEYVNHADEEDSQDAVQITPPGRPDLRLDTEAGPSATQSRPADDDVYVSLPGAEGRVGSTSQTSISQSRAESRPPFHHLAPPPPSYSESMYQGYSSSRHHPEQRSSCCHAQKDTSCSHSFGRPSERGDKHVKEGYERHAHSSRHHPRSQRSYRREYNISSSFSRWKIRILHFDHHLDNQKVCLLLRTLIIRNCFIYTEKLFNWKIHN